MSIHVCITGVLPIIHAIQNAFLGARMNTLQGANGFFQRESDRREPERRDRKTTKVGLRSHKQPPELANTPGHMQHCLLLYIIHNYARPTEL